MTSTKTLNNDRRRAFAMRLVLGWVWVFLKGSLGVRDSLRQSTQNVFGSEELFHGRRDDVGDFHFE
jgi:hypothetical protein